MQSHFKFSNKQRNGIVLLLFLVLILQSVYFFVEFPKRDIEIDQAVLVRYQNKIDSLKLINKDKNKASIYPFNPNFISDYKGYVLGMSNEEINRLFAFREKNQWINSAKQFQHVTQISDSLLNVISPYFKFPKWVSTSHSKAPKLTSVKTSKNLKFLSEKLDLNMATSNQLQQVYGIGEKLAMRIIKYRDKYEGGFISNVQLSEIYGLTPEVIQRINEQFTVKRPREIPKITLNTATIDELVKIPYIDYEVANQIIEQRTLREGFLNVDSLIHIKDFPQNKIDIIKLYLEHN